MSKRKERTESSIPKMSKRKLRLFLVKEIWAELNRNRIYFGFFILGQLQTGVCVSYLMNKIGFSAGDDWKRRFP
jgi:uncharacterized transporter YbjL